MNPLNVLETQMRMFAYFEHLATSDDEYKDLRSMSDRHIHQINGLVVRLLTDPSRLSDDEISPNLFNYVTSFTFERCALTEELIKATKSADELRSNLEYIETTPNHSLSRNIGTLEVLALLTAMSTRIKMRTDADEIKTISINLTSAIDFLYGNSSSIAKNADRHPLYVSTSSNSEKHSLPPVKDNVMDVWLSDPAVRPALRSTTAIPDIAFYNKMNLQEQKQWRRKQNTQNWIDYLLEEQGIKPEQVCEIGPYHPDLNLTYKREENISDGEAKNRLVEFLAHRFSVMFDLANTLLKLIDVATYFDITKLEELTNWVGSGRLPMTPDNLSLLPIVEALNEKVELMYLVFREPLKGMGGKMPPLLVPLKGVPFKGVSDTAKEIILGTFFNKVSISNSPVAPPVLYFLRPRNEMLVHLMQLSAQERSAIKDIDFYDYLERMGYPDKKLQSVEYQGYFGLLKAVEIHSLSHLALGEHTGYQWPFYYSDLV